jgi:hypothetical protein
MLRLLYLINFSVKLNKFFNSKYVDKLEKEYYSMKFRNKLQAEKLEFLIVTKL